MSRLLIRFAGLAAVALYSSGVCASESSPLAFSFNGVDFFFNGFGTLGVVHSDEDRADFTPNGRQPKGVGFTNSWSATPDSRLGAQLSANFTDRLSGVVQFVSQYQHDGSFTPYVEWANVKYQLTPDLNIRVGRIALPTFMFSDSLTVGYALPYVRIPVEIFSQVPSTNSDGIDGSYRFHVGKVTNTTQLFAGGFDLKTPGGGSYEVHDLRGVSNTVEFGATTLHFSYQKGSSDLHIPGFSIVDDPKSIGAVGATYDPGKWYVSGEWMRSRDELFGDYQGWYVMGGYRTGNFTPYIGHARAYKTGGGSLGPTSFIEQGTDTFGLRWDFTKQADLKLQLDRTNRHGSVNAFFTNQQPGFEAAGSLNILSFTVNFVF